MPAAADTAFPRSLHRLPFARELLRFAERLVRVQRWPPFCDLSPQVPKLRFQFRMRRQVAIADTLKRFGAPSSVRAFLVQRKPNTCHPCRRNSQMPQLIKLRYSRIAIRCQLPPSKFWPTRTAWRVPLLRPNLTTSLIPHLLILISRVRVINDAIDH
jgi:hypothetical protein